MLPSMVPHARIFTLDWNANYSSNAPVATILGQADRLLAVIFQDRQNRRSVNKPIIFIASCFGGILLMQAIKRAAEAEHRYSSLLQATVGIIFLASPLRGCKSASDAMWKIYVNGVLGKGPSDSLVKDLDGESELLRKLLQEFCETVNKRSLLIPIHCFYETQPTLVYKEVVGRASIRKLLVDEDAACVDCGERTPLHARHGLMNKFRDQNDDNFKVVGQRIQEFANEAPKLLEFRKAWKTSPRDRHWMVPRQTCCNFVGRARQLKTVKEALQDSTPSSTDIQKRFVVTGAEGQGKSELCLKIAEELRGEFWGIFWADVSTHELAEAGFMSIASKVGFATRRLNDSLKCLVNNQENWLLILDNANDPDVDYAKYFPPCQHGSIILSSKHQKFTRHNTVGFLNLKNLGMMDSITLLHRFIDRPVTLGSPAAQSASRVAIMLDYHTHSLVQAGACISRCHLAFEQYVFEYERQHQQIPPYRRSHTTCEVSAKALATRFGSSGSAASKLLSIISALPCDTFPESLLEDTWKHYLSVRNQEETGRGSLKNGSLEYAQERPKSCDLSSFQYALQLLTSFSFISSTYDQLKIDPSVREWASRRQRTREYVESWAIVGSILVSRDSKSSMHASQPRTHLFAFLQSRWRSELLDKHTKNFSQGFLTHVAGILSQLVQTLMDSSYQTDDHDLDQIVDDVFHLLDSDPATPHKELLPLYKGSISSQNIRTPHKTCISLLQKNANLHNSTTPLGSWQLALAKASIRTGQFHHAEKILRLLLKSRQKMLPENISIARAMLAVVRWERGMHEEAVQSLSHVVHKAPTDHARLLLPYKGFLGFLYGQQGRCDQAIMTLEDVLYDQMNSCREKHDLTLMTRHYLAIFYGKAHRFGDAIDLQKRTVELIPSEKTSLLSRAERNLGNSYILNGDYELALAPLFRACDILLRHKHQASSDSELSEVELILADCLYRTGRYEAARVLLKDVIKISHANGHDEPGMEAERLLTHVRRKMSDRDVEKATHLQVPTDGKRRHSPSPTRDMKRRKRTSKAWREDYFDSVLRAVGSADLPVSRSYQ